MRISINTKEAPFVHLQPEYTGSYVVVNQNGYYVNGTFAQSTKALDMYGYGGVIVYVSMFGYVAYDLACPYCASRGLCSPCEAKGGTVVCPICGEEYNLYDGSGMPNKGIAHEQLLRITDAKRVGDVISVQQ